MIVIDIEMSGIEPSRHSILSIGAVDFTNPRNQFYIECRMRKGAVADPRALAVNGFTKKQIMDRSKPDLRTALLEFIKWSRKIKDRTIAGHNVQFDIKFLKYSFAFYDMNYSVGSRCIDTHSLTYAHYLKRKIRPPMDENRSDITSEVVARYVGLPTEPKPHNALNGARIEAEEFSRLIHGRNLLKEYAEFPVPSYLKPKK